MRSTLIFAAFLALASPTLSLVAGSGESEQQVMEAINGSVHTFESWSWVNCGLSDDGVKIESIQISPDPPKPGKDLTVTVKALVQREIKEGANANVIVKVGLINIIKKNYDICEEARKANATVQCPVLPDSYTISHTVALPKDIPPANFNVEVKGLTPDDTDMFCVKLTADFSKA
ncbi:Phosphatidylglycerol/phosphatidylinositol transfer protein [Psilocybe cubensis]|uniref:Phosphatidylglycerol/phosphatidylinositol transfer protein n=2 Tax=Psilocybe cubensis TaxID=181762 RepID=A0A8H7XZW9_PSICU|nr:Phosphatidylglycerol/phosphatidylinositol transfer protein [Psilocybe cubensis]KAH9483498.1 Phosphatidylglycerol/phosphatidylinositol transfer protein [Psilocybe cubensis]